MTMVEENPALARKRRIEQRRAEKRCSDDALSNEDVKRVRLSDFSDGEGSDDPDGDRLLPSIRGIKRQARYEPGVPMTKEELQKWRKQARRVRNRESAAASRQKTRQRIDELEGEVSELQAELAAARARIAELEAVGASSGSPSVSEVTVKIEKNESHQVSPVPSPTASPSASPLPPPRSFSPQGFSLDDTIVDAPVPLLPTMILDQQQFESRVQPYVSQDNPCLATFKTLPAAKINMGEDGTGTIADVSSSDEADSGNDQASDVASEDEELGSFLWDALTDYDPNLEDLAELCA
eukprot:CAMPEP_0172439032 /NCGR_PEP_ID=MMETSP1065-20121228/142_1 /TAXON_ID=265537 /ORGANISM="Amphiprora paludosa, Strain CCMP125" /LENGTH=294 /DNA_ID=CAMNT_0013187655 /DNA_START=173 /DNA_END=1058 /DNA_ORIENTATION=+